MLGNVIPGSNRIPGSRNTAASATKALPNTRSEVSAKLKLSQLSTLQRRDSSLIWPFAAMETVERTVFLQLSLADTRMCALSSVLVVDMSSIAARMSYQLATLARHWTRANVNVFSSSMARVQCSATWFLVATELLEALTQQHQQPNNLPHTRSEVSANRRLCQLSTLRRRHSSLILPLKQMETVVTGWHLHAFSVFRTVDCCDLDCFTNVLARHWTRANVFSSSMANVQCSATWFLVATGFQEAVTLQHQRLKLFPTQGLRCLPSSSFFSFQHCEGDTLHWSTPLRKWKLWREWFAHKCHWLTPACEPFLQYWWSIWAPLLHGCPINQQHWQDIERGQMWMFFLPAWQEFNAR